MDDFDPARHDVGRRSPFDLIFLDCEEIEGDVEGPGNNRHLTQMKLISIICGLLFAISASFSGLLQAAESSFESLAEITSYRNQNLEAHPELKAAFRRGFTIPGLSAGFVPQGMSPVPEENALVLSGYIWLSYKGFRKWKKVSKKRSVLLLVDADEGNLLSAALLRERSGAPMRRHAGGVQVAGKSLWIPSKNKLYRFSFGSLLRARGELVELSPLKVFAVDSKGSFVSGFGDFLLVGEFIKERDQVPAYHQSPSGKHNAWTALYRLERFNEADDSEQLFHQVSGKVLLRPDAVIHHRKKVQGLAVREDGWVVQSVSYGSKPSKLAFYQVLENLGSPESWPGRTRLPNGFEVPSITLSGESNWQFTQSAPPGSEEVFWLDDDRLAFVFEGGAYPYREKWKELEDRVLIFDLGAKLNQWLQSKQTN